ncbi:MAG: hypothetical protein AAGB97_04610 [Dehalococcoidia bacterium]|nr:hypothetical protein [Chloroflexota bacterium]
MLESIIIVRLIFVLGILNLVTGALICFSCRCVPGAGIMGKLVKSPAYKRFYKYHCYLWWVFWPSVLVHAILAILVFGTQS